MEKRDPDVYYEDLPRTARLYLFPGRLLNAGNERWNVSERQLEVWSVPTAVGLFLATVWLSAFVRDSYPVGGALLVHLALWANIGGVWWSLRKGKTRIKELKRERLRDKLPHEVFPELMNWLEEDVIDIGDEKTWYYEGISRRGILQLDNGKLDECKNVDLYVQDTSSIVNRSLKSRQARGKRSENDKLYQKVLSSIPGGNEDASDGDSSEGLSAR